MHSEARVVVARARAVNGHLVTVFIAGAVITREARDPLNKNTRYIYSCINYCQALKVLHHSERELDQSLTIFSKVHSL